MKTQTVKKTKLNASISKKASGMIDEKGKSKIAEEVISGHDKPLTGSTSTGRYAKYQYYPCAVRKCKVRIRLIFWTLNMKNY